jgi:hypothetical protein
MPRHALRPDHEPRGITHNSYSFVDKDPVIADLRDVIGKDSFAVASRKTTLSVACFRNWFYGPTRKPAHSSVQMVYRAYGWKTKRVKMTEADEAPLPIVSAEPIPHPRRSKLRRPLRHERRQLARGKLRVVK